MRDYAKFAPQFWTGETGRELRRRASEGACEGAGDALLVAAYLISSPHSNMLGLFYQPVLYMAEETGLGMEGASKGLQVCIEVGFCQYDPVSKMVWVVEMAKWQIAASLKSGDLRCKGVQREYDSLADNPFLAQFFDRYSEAFHMTHRRVPKQRPSEAPYQAPSQGSSKPLRSQEQEQEQEQEEETLPAARADSLFPEAGKPEVARTPCRFEEFWSAWPKSPRKQDKKPCAEKWARKRLDAEADAILADLEAQKRSRQWIDGFEPAPLTYLNRERWRDGAADVSGQPVEDERFAGAV